MPRNRIIKPTFWQSENIAKLSFNARLLYIALWNYADDKGRLRGQPDFLRNMVFPYDSVSTHGAFTEWLGELVELNRAFFYIVDDNLFLYLPKFNNHQLINRPSPSLLPPYSKKSHVDFHELFNVKKKGQFSEASMSTHRALTEASLTNEKEKEKENVNENPEAAFGEKDLQGKNPIKTPPDDPSKIDHRLINFYAVYEQLTCRTFPFTPRNSGGAKQEACEKIFIALMDDWGFDEFVDWIKTKLERFFEKNDEYPFGLEVFERDYENELAKLERRKKTEAAAPPGLPRTRDF